MDILSTEETLSKHLFLSTERNLNNNGEESLRFFSFSHVITYNKTHLSQLIIIILLLL